MRRSRRKRSASTLVIFMGPTACAAARACGVKKGAAAKARSSRRVSFGGWGRMLQLRDGFDDGVAGPEQLGPYLGSDPGSFEGRHVTLLRHGDLVDEVRVLMRVLPVVALHDQEVRDCRATLDRSKVEQGASARMR